MLIIDAPHFYAACILDGTRICMAAPILRYMVGWQLSKAEEYCYRKGWKCTLH